MVAPKIVRCVYCGNSTANITRDHPIPQAIARNFDKLFKQQAITVNACTRCNKKKDYTDREVTLIVNHCDQGLPLTQSFRDQLHQASVDRILAGQHCWISDPIVLQHRVVVPINWNSIRDYAEFAAMGLLSHHAKLTDASVQAFPQRDVVGRTANGIQHIQVLTGILQSMVPAGQGFTFYSDAGRFNDVVKYDIAHSSDVNIVLLRLGQNLKFEGEGMPMAAIRVVLATNAIPNILQYKI